MSLAKVTDLVIVAPASANVIGKIANGIADDMLTTTIMACRCKKIIAPAMNTNMYLNPVVQDNIKKLKHYEMEVIIPDTGHLACGDEGIGKMPSEQVLLDYILRELALQKDMAGKKVLVTAGPTMEKIDPVRFISNHSTGKMGYALAENAMLRGADVTLVTGKTSISPPPFVKVVPVISARDMFEAVAEHMNEQDIIIKSAAVADYRPVNPAEEKIKKKEGDMSVKLERTEDILKYIGEHRKENQFICGFSMETENMVENSRRKLEEKKADMIVANHLKQKGAGFGTDTNIVTFITRDKVLEKSIMTKKEVAGEILDFIIENFF